MLWRSMRWWHVWGKSGEYRILVSKPERKIPPGRPRPTWEDNTKVYLQEIWLEGAGWIYVARDKDTWQVLMSTVMNFRVPYMLWISWLADELSASQEERRSSSYCPYSNQSSWPAKNTWSPLTLNGLSRIYKSRQQHASLSLSVLRSTVAIC
jgi:hypothetical protein